MEPDLRVEVNEGIVTLRGTVRYRRDIETIDAAVAGVGGVVDVRNEATAEEDGPPPPPPEMPFDEDRPGLS